MSIQDTMPEKEDESPVPEDTKGDDGQADSKTPPKDEEEGRGEDSDQSGGKGEGEEKEEEEVKEGESKEGKSNESEEKKPKIDPKDWPLRGIKEPGDNDVLFGRGGGTNHAKGNKLYRKMVEDRKLEYVNSKRLDKPLVALEIIRIWRAQDPPGRFLKLDSNGTWSDVGDKKAREKTSQALREKAPLIRKQLEEDKQGSGGEENCGDEKERSTKTTRFAEGTNSESKGTIKKAVLARDHSLGREYLQAGETMNLEGFSWRDPLDSQSSGSQGSLPPPPPPGEYPVQRMSSGSMGMPPPSEYRVPSIGPPPPPVGGPPPPGYFHRTPTDEYRQTYPNAPVMPGYSGYGPHQRSGSWTHSPAHAMPPLREHSLSQNPLRNASASHPAPINAFDSGRNGSVSGYWGDPRQHPPPPSQPYGGHYRDGSGTYPQPPPARDYCHGREYNPRNGHSSMMPPPVAVAPPYVVDPAIAKTWSGQSDEDISKMYDKDFGARDAKNQKQPPVALEQMGFDHDRNDESHLPRPQIVKRMTSNQNETLETKKDLVGPSVKRAALNRDNSLASNRLKATHLPEYFGKNGKFDPEREMNTLTDNLEQSTLNTDRPQPKSLDSTERTSTIDHIADLMVKPGAITDNSRSSTIDALALDDLESDPVIQHEGTSAMPKPSALSASNRMSTMEACFADLEQMTAKPSALRDIDRVSTRDYLDLDDPLTEIDIDRVYEQGD